MNIFPHVLIRVSGGAFEKLESLNIKESIQIKDEILQLKEKLSEVKQSISHQLYELIPREKDSRVQSLLLNVRRDVFNERNIAKDRVAALIPYLPDRLNKELKNYLKLKETIDNLMDTGEDIFPREVLQARKHLHFLAADETLQKGLLLSSQSLRKQIPAYLSKVSPSNKKDFQTERGLMKYISRLYAKTSPFSTFTNLMIAKPMQTSDPKTPFLWVKKGDKSRILHHIRLNNYLYSYLKTLLCKNPTIYLHFLIRPNPTLKQCDTYYLYLTNNENIEAFQRIPANPVLEVFWQLTAEKKEGIPFKDLVQTIIDNEYIDAPAEDIHDYINQLIGYGFLEFNIGVSGIDPDWDIKLREVLNRINRGSTNIPLLKRLVETLASIRTLADQYGEAPCRKRSEILKKAFHQFKDICMRLHEAAGLPEEERKASPEEWMKGGEEKKKENGSHDTDDDKPEEEEVFKHLASTNFLFKPEQMFYEDTTVNITHLVNEKSLTEFISSLHGLLQKVRHFEGHCEERDKMRYFFINKYGKDASVELMTFYEEYYREFKKPEAELLQKRERVGKEPAEKEKPDPEEKEEKFAFLTVPKVEERQEKNRAWLDFFTALVKEEISTAEDVIPLSCQQVERAHQEFPVEMTQTGIARSYGSFIQFYMEKKPGGEEKLMGVLNVSFPGFGKLLSRFLHIFDDSITNDLRQWNKSVKGDFLLMEDCDASYFNANLHPPLLPYEVRIPGGHNSLPPENQIPITELEVRLDKTGDHLQLVHKSSKKQVYVFDLGFQGHRRRSQLFQLLEKFTMAERLLLAPLVNAVTGIGQLEDKEDEETDEIRVTPRVVYDNRIVLRRKTWYIPQEKLPYKTPGESQWTYFLRINEWRHQLQLPDEVFVHVVDWYQLLNVRPSDLEKLEQNLSQDDYKPQYISFNNPFLIDLFERIIKRVPFSLRIVEMLPNSQQLYKVRGSRHITEFTLQWYNGITNPGKTNESF